jgi:hypothetical protein
MRALGMNLHDVQKTLGWSSLEMLSMRYAPRISAAPD